MSREPQEAREMAKSVVVGCSVLPGTKKDSQQDVIQSLSQQGE